MKKTIIQKFSEHGTFVQPDTMKYILSKEKPEDFTSFIIKNLDEYPLVLTLSIVKQLENQDVKEEKITPPAINEQEKKELQKKMLTTIYSESELKPELFDDDIENEYDDPDKDDQINISDEPAEQKTIEKIDIKKVKGWKPLAKEYDAEIEIIKDVTGNSECEGTTGDFTKLFVDRYKSLRKILRNQRRELANAMPINRIKKSGVKEIQIVGIVKEVRTTTNGHRLIEIEDETDTATCIALKQNRNTHQMANEVVFDEIIGIKGNLSKNGDLVVLNLSLIHI